MEGESDKVTKDTQEVYKMIACISPSSKDAINDLLDKKLETKELSQDEIRLIFDIKGDIKKIPDCKPEKKTRKKRNPSQYNLFVSDCLKGDVSEAKLSGSDDQPTKMRKCALVWKKVKNKLT